MAEKNY